MFSSKMSSGVPDLQRKALTWSILATWVAVLLAGFLLYFSLLKVDWGTAFRLIQHAQFPLLAVGAAISSMALLLRSLRWRVLLQSQGRARIGPVFWATSAGYFGNNFLPARAGELVRAYIISSRSGFSAAFVLTTALTERVSDAIALIVICSVALLVLPNPPGWLAQVARPAAIVALGAIGMIAFAPSCEGALKRLLFALPFPAGLRSKAVEALGASIQGIRALHDWSRLTSFVLFTASIWFFDATATVVGARALGMRFSYAISFLLIAGLGLGSALPSTPGYIGIYQFVAVSVLVPFGFSRTSAIAYILVAQAISYFVIGFWGGIGLWRVASDSKDMSSLRSLSSASLLDPASHSGNKP